MSSGFSFDFLPGEQDEEKNQSTSTAAINSTNKNSVESNTFRWCTDLDSKFDEALKRINLAEYDRIPISDSVDIKRVRENEYTPTNLQNTDLIPGYYEGGLKVWECSVDLCRYLQENNVPIQGYVLELGCGHGLPGCWVLKQMSEQKSLTDDGKEMMDTDAQKVDEYSPPRNCQLSGLIFSDFNEFVLNNVTIPNILLNSAKKVDDSTNDFSRLSRHVALGFGDWNDMSDQLLSSSCGSDFPPSVPNDGKFELILAAETTYSSTAASDTARLLAKHLRKSSGVAFIATKRYYFGVGGGSDTLKAALTAASLPNNINFNVETVMVYDNGAGNIRELLKVQALSR
jgi:predicted nicotinamide N-methyase